MSSGRINASQFWKSIFLWIIFTSIIMSVFFFLVFFSSTLLIFGLVFLFAPLQFASQMIPLLLLFPGIGLLVRRFHDIGLPSWIVIPPFIIIGLILYQNYIIIIKNISYNLIHPYALLEDVIPLSTTKIAILLVLSVVGIYMASRQGTRGPNKYGEEAVYPSIWAAIWGRRNPVAPAPRFWSETQL